MGTGRVENEYAVNEYFIEIQRLTKELKKNKNKRESDRVKLQKRLTTQVRACDNTREAANRALECVLEVYPEALSLITESSLKGNTPTNSPLSPSMNGRRGGGGGKVTGKSSPMSLILEQGGRVRRAEKTSRTGGMSMSTTKSDTSKHSKHSKHSNTLHSSSSHTNILDILEWTPAQVGAWLANEVNLPHLVPKFVSEAVDGQLLLTLTDADLAGELGMMDQSRERSVDDDIHAVERKRVLDAIKTLRTKNKEDRKKREAEAIATKEAAANKMTSPSRSPKSTGRALLSPSMTSPSQLERRLSHIETDSERVELLTQELLSMQVHHTTLRQQHSALSTNLEREKEQSKKMRVKHQQERKEFERKMIQEQQQQGQQQQNQRAPKKIQMEIPAFIPALRSASTVVDPAIEAAPKEAAAKEAAAKDKKARLKAMFAVNEIPSFHTVRPPKGLVTKHEPRKVTMSEIKTILKTPTFSSSPTKHVLQKKDAGKKLTFLPPEQNSLAIIPRVPEDQNEELWWTMADLDISSAEADQENMVEELEKLEELRLKQGGQLTRQQQQTENELQMQLELQGYDMSQMDPEMQQQLLMSMDPMMMYGMEPGDEEDMEGDQWLPPDTAFLQQQQEQGGQPWGGGVVFAGDDDYDEYQEYQDEEEQMQEQMQEQKAKQTRIGNSNGNSTSGSSKQGTPGQKHGSPSSKNKNVIPTGGGMNSPTADHEEVMDETISDASFEIGDSDEDDDAF